MWRAPDFTWMEKYEEAKADEHPPNDQKHHNINEKLLPTMDLSGGSNKIIGKNNFSHSDLLVFVKYNILYVYAYIYIYIYILYFR